MKVTFLGTGTSIGVPAIGCQCEVCRSTDPRDKRLRASILVEMDSGLRILIDCGPDFRQQILTQPFGKLDAVFITHMHYDHVAGMDDLRPFCLYGDVNVYGQGDVVDGLRTTMPYCFKEHLYPGVPRLLLHEVEAGRAVHVSRPDAIEMRFPPSGASMSGILNTEGRVEHVPPVTDSVSVVPIPLMHGQLPILGYRIGRFAYITDMKAPLPQTLALLEGVDTLVVNALRFDRPHHSHQLVDDAVDFAHRLGARTTYLTHVTHDIGTHPLACARLPQGVSFAYDGQTITVAE